MSAEHSFLPLTGYAEQLSGRSGDTIDFKVSSQLDQPYNATLVRVVCADPNPAGPGQIEIETEVDLNGPFPGRNQPFYPGSYAQANINGLLDQVSQFTLSAAFQPMWLESGRQTIVNLAGDSDNSAGISLSVLSDGNIGLQFGHENKDDIILECEVRNGQWCRVTAAIDLTNLAAQLRLKNLADGSQKSTEYLRFTGNHGTASVGVTEITIGANWNGRAGQHFNGKIEGPQILLGLGNVLDPNQVLASWDFSKNISSSEIVDIGPAGHHGHLVNYPTRAVTGSNWDGSEMNWRHAPDQYGGIHFHADDIYDFQWKTDFSFTIPDDLATGAYAMRIDSGEHRDWIPFFVCAPKGPRSSRLCVLVSTYTYVIYGNHARPDFDASWLQKIKQRNGYPWNPAAFKHYGLSTYNTHLDGSGVCHASHKRPLMNMRPGYITFPGLDCSGLRHYQADSHLLCWLEQNGIDFDLITDHELHHEGVDALDGYAAICTGTHPEYHTSAMLDALQSWRTKGGNFVYLGGNGFYWRIGLDPEHNETLEVRRAEGGIRAWAAEPGEYYQAFDGAYGGLWRRNRRPPQQLAGVGFSAQGTFYGSYYRRTSVSFVDPELDWIFHGIDDEILGDFGLCGGGAAGFELDRYDRGLGSDPSIKVIASSEGHGDEFTLVPEERLTHITNWPGVPEEELIRADMVYQKAPNGGQLFATGSITFCGSLLHNNGDNNISRLLKNIIDRFTG